MGLRRPRDARIACWSIRARWPAPTARCPRKKKRAANASAPRRYSGIVEYSFAPDSRHLLIPLNGDLYVYDLARKPADAVRRLTSTDAYETDARFSPRSNFVSFVRDQNLYVIDLASGTERAVTREGGGLVSFGVAEFIAQEEMDRDTGYWWSPDERHIALARVDESPVAEVERFEIQATGATRGAPALSGHRRAQCARRPVRRGPRGREPPAARPRRRCRRLSTATSTGFRTAAASPCSARAATRRRSSCCASTRSSGRGRVLITEHSDSWVPLNHELTFLQRTPQFIWASSRDGFQHLYLYGNDGKLIRQLTSGEFMVVGESPEAAIRAVDERARRVYFTANLPSPIERQLYWVSLDSPGAPQRVTTRRRLAQHRDVEGCARVRRRLFECGHTAQRHACARASGKLLTDDAAEPARCHASVCAVRRRTRARGVRHASPPPTDRRCNTELLKPRNLAPGKRYPVIVDVYGGPGVQRVTNTWGKPVPPVPGAARLRGVPARQPRQRHARRALRDGARAAHGRCRSAGPGARAWNSCAACPSSMRKRIGIFGWSYGGYMTLMCLMQAPDSFAAGVAGAPVTDWALYDTHYTERYLSTPQLNPEGYAAEQRARVRATT